ncbi:MAG: hypothetical protein EOO75_07855 [Myxococcales bacterium]|nr:MAG: hypothetical protein EOO75_07855 [Myxococcales bacterium]
MLTSRAPRRQVMAGMAGMGLFSLTEGCRRTPRCLTCGMTLDLTSRWYAEVTAAGHTDGFDTPKCALRRLLTPGAPAGTLTVRGYYRQEKLPGERVVFAAGSDVLGPMGADLVPVEPEHAVKFRVEHHAAKTLPLAELTLALVEAT